MRRPRFRRTASSRASTFEYMVSIPQSPTQESLRDWDTGFPESFCGSKLANPSGGWLVWWLTHGVGRNTSLPHPEAKLGPNACLTEEDVNPARALMRYRMSFEAQRGLNSRSSTMHDRKLSGSSEDGALQAFSRLALNSLRAAESSLDAFLSKDDDSIKSSDGTSSRDPDSPLQHGKEFDAPIVDPRDAVRDPRDGRRRGGLMSRLVHR